MKNIVIIGGVAAGATAAARARRIDGEANITLLEAGSDVSFANCGLPYYIGGDIENRSSLILASPQTFHDQYRVKVQTNTEAISIDRAKKILTAKNTQTGEIQTYPYDSLILAQGGKPIVPPILGAEKDHVFQLWTLADMDGIDQFITQKEPKKAVVVGGGFIGLEMVEALAKRGMDVSLVEMAPQVMPNLEKEMAGFLSKELLDFGIDLHLGKSVTEINDNQVVLQDGSKIDTDFVLLSIGVRATLKLAQDAGLELGVTGNLKVTSTLQTSDPSIFAAGDMVEIEHRVLGKTIKLPLAGPANRQGRIVAENALGGSKTYKGALGSSVVKVFSAVAANTGLSLTAARQGGIDADAVVVHKVSHTAYYPGAEKVSLMLVYEKTSQKVIGAQAVGRVGVDKRIDVIATAIAGGLTVEDLSELDLAYAPPFNSPNGPVNMAAFTALNHAAGFSPQILAQDLEAFALEHQLIALDLRDPISFRKANLSGSQNVSLNILRDNLDQIPKDQPVLLISDDGQKGHVALRMMVGAGFTKVWNLSGGYYSLERYARMGGLTQLRAGLLPVEKRSMEELEEGAGKGKGKDTADDDAAQSSDNPLAGNGPIIVDVRTIEEFQMGAVPGAVHIPLDELHNRAKELGSPDREITLYCASGARSSYGQRILMQLGFTKVENGGGLHDMMARM
jgi:NADPH-dependent 2,4-dienoyl-CoA reductase/sulfur reductase-like enzyme/rhodanese-related sulfurtransferase